MNTQLRNRLRQRGKEKKRKTYCLKRDSEENNKHRKRRGEERCLRKIHGERNWDSREEGAEEE